MVELIVEKFGIVGGWGLGVWWAELEEHLTFVVFFLLGGVELEPVEAAVVELDLLFYHLALE